MSKVKFHYNYKPVAIARKSAIKSFIETLFIEEGRALHLLDYIFCSDEYLLEMNKSYLNHDTYTDVITFSLSEVGQPIAGESYISLDRVKENSTIYSVSFQKELLRVLFHSALHLCGYGDKTKRESLLMRSKEDHYLRLYAQNQ